MRMKKFSALLVIFCLIASCEKYDDSALWKAVNENTAKIQALQTRIDNLNNRIDELQRLVEAANNKESIKAISELSDGTGYTILFTSGKSIVIHHGVNGKNGTNGTTPAISVRQDTDGIWYWTINGEWLLNSQGEKVAASGKDGKDGNNGNNGSDGQDGQDGHDGKDGKDGVTPQLKIEEDYWYVSVDGGISWTKLGKATGENGYDGKDGKDGDAFFKGVRQDENYAYFELNDGTIITLPLEVTISFNIVLDSDSVPVMSAGESKTIGYILTKATDKTIVKAIAQNGWTATIVPKTKDSGEIIVQAPNPIVSSEILVFASDGEGHTVMAVLDCVKGQCTVAKTNYTVSSEKGEIDLVITTNIPYQIVIPEEAQSWISVKPATKATITETKTLIIQENTEYQKRFATIRLIDDKSNTIQTVEVLQEAAAFSGELSITVNAPGTLASVLSAYSYSSIKSISISGPLNDADYAFIKDNMISLRSLDLSGATGVEPIFTNHRNTPNLIILPSGQTTISDNAFSGSNVVQVILPGYLQSIGTSAFYNCSKMSGAIYIPKTVTYIGPKAFDGTLIESFSFADGIQLLKFEDASLPPRISSLRVPASLIALNASALANLTSLKTLSFEEGSIITEIPSFCFANLPLETVSLPESLIKIGGKNSITNSTIYRGGRIIGGAFESCTSLQSIIIPKNVETIEPAAFHNSGLKQLTFDEGCKIETINGWSYSSSRVGAFSSTQIETLSLPTNITEIQNAAFADCSKLRSIDFSAAKGLKTIGGYNGNDGYTSGAFYSCSGIQYLTIPASVEEIHPGAFSDCTGLVSIQFEPNSHLTKIEGSYYYGNDGLFYGIRGAFSNCKSITSFTIPASVKVIEAGAFKGCSSLANLFFESGSQCEQIMGISESGAFDGTVIQKLTLPSSMKRISSYALSRMNNLTTITIAEGANVAFSSLSCVFSRKLSIIDASKAAFSAESGAFAFTYVPLGSGIGFYQDYCPIATVKVGAIHPPECASNAFGDLSNAKLYVPGESVNDYKQETGWNRFGTILSL